MPRTFIENAVVAYLDNEDSSDISNPIHSTEVAKAYGFTGPLVGGVTVWGWATDTILAALGEDWLGDGWAEYSFRHPTFPGDTLTIRAVLDAEPPSGSWKVEMINQSDEVCVVGKVGLGEAVWSHEFIRPLRSSLPKIAGRSRYSCKLPCTPVLAHYHVSLVVGSLGDSLPSQL